MAPDLGTGVPGYPNPNSFVGNVASDPATPGDNTWWFNTTEGAVKGYVVNGATAEVVRFVPNASGTTIIDQDTTLPAGSYSYNNLLVTNDATLTLDGGANVIVTGTASILAGASVVMGVGGSGSSFYAGNLLNAGTLTSSNAADLISLQNSSNNGTNTIAGELIFLAGGTHDLSSGIAGTGVTDVSNGATLSIPAGFTVNFSCTTLKGSGTIAVRDGATFNVAENLSIGSSAPIFSGPGTLQVNSPYTLTVTAAAETYSIGAIAGTGTVAFGTATITIGANSVWSVAALTFTGVLNFTGTDTTLEISVSYSLGVTMVTGANSSIITVDTGKTLTFTAPIDLDGGTITGLGTVAFGANAVTVTTSETFTIAHYTATETLTITGAAVTLTMGANETLGFATVAGTGTLSVGPTFTLTVGATTSFTVAKVAGAGTLSISNTFSVTVDASATWTIATVAGAGTLSVSTTFTLTASSGITLNVASLAGLGTVAFGASTVTIGGNESWTVTAYTATGTLTVSGGFTLTFGASYTLAFAAVTGAGTWALGSTTLTVTANTTWSVASYTATGVLTVTGAAVVVTVAANLNIGFGTVGGTGGVSVSVGSTWTATGAVTFPIATLKGAGTVAFGANTVTISGSLSSAWSVSSYTASGELLFTGSAALQLNANYNLGFTSIVVTVGFQPTVTGTGTITIAAPVSISASSGNPLFQLNCTIAGSSTITVSTPMTVNAGGGTLGTYNGNLVVNGVTTFVVWIDSRFTRGTGAGGTVTKPIGTITGTGLFLAAPGISATATGTVTLASGTSITAGGTALGTATGSTHPCYWTDIAGTTTWSANATGVYYLGYEDTTGTTYAVFLYVYFGTSSNAYVLVNQWVNTWSDSQNTNTDTFRPYSSSASAGTITTGGGNTPVKF